MDWFKAIRGEGRGAGKDPWQRLAVCDLYEQAHGPEWDQKGGQNAKQRHLLLFVLRQDLL
jgi:hypothetical protein